MPFPRIYNLEQLADSTANEISTATFRFDDVSPKKLFTLPAGVKILTTQIKIKTAFNGAAPSLTLGTLATPNNYIDTFQNDPKTVEEYETNPLDELAVATDIYIFIVPSASTQGEGVVVIEHDRP